MTTHGLIFMTALVPTIGHQYLINFASNFVDQVHVIISTRSNEPTTFTQRAASMWSASNVTFYEHHDDDAPQNPKDVNDEDFWGYWASVVHDTVPDFIDYVFASEPYGAQVARSLGYGVDFIPVDIAREVFPVKGTDVRTNLFANQHLIADGFKKCLRMNIVLFGPESCGKTTMARRLAEVFNGVYLPEWARPYLETVGAEVTQFKLEMIVNGQYASERAVDQTDNILRFKDTDLITTRGFYRYNGISEPEQLKWMLADYPNDLYIVMNDNIPFTEDQLRYGGDKRETSKQFWIDLLKEHKRPYYEVKAVDPGEQLIEVVDMLMNYELTKTGLTYSKLKNFQRD